MLVAALLLVGAVNPPSLSLLAPWSGHCWKGRIAPGSVDTHCFAPVYGGAHVRDRHQVVEHGRVVYQGETIYSRQGGRLLFTYWNSLGGVGQGQVEPEAGGLHFTGSMHAAPDSPPQAIDTHWRQADPRAYNLVNGANPTVRFTRVR